jgi:PAS domain S-box-containing protein
VSRGGGETMSRRFINFTVFSLVGLLLVSYLLVSVFQRVNRATLESHFHEHNIVLARMLRNVLVETRLQDLLSGELGSTEGMPALEAKLREYLRDLPVAKVKIFDRGAAIIYSSTASEVGSDAGQNPGVVAALNGRSTGSMVHRDRFNSFDGVIENRDLHQQYIPIREPETDQVEGVFELYSDVTPLIRDISLSQRRFLLALLGLLGAFFLGQVWLYFRADRLLAREQAQTQGYLDELEKVRADLENRVVKRTEELESSRYFLQSVVDGIANPLFVIRPDLKVSMMNAAARRLIPGDAALDQFSYCYQISHRRDTPCEGSDHPCSFAEVMKTQATTTVQHQHYDAENRSVIVDVVSTPLCDKDGVLQGIIEVQHDVTDLVQAREKLARSEACLQAIMDNVPDAILTLDRDGRIDSANRAASRLFKLDAGLLVGRRFQNLFCPDQADRLLTGGHGVREYCAMRGEDQRFPVDLWIGTLDLEGRGSQVAVVRDIAERKRAERLLEQTRQQYHHQEKMAAIGQLAAGILHEVGNPIAAIAGAAHDMRLTEESVMDKERGCGLDSVVQRNLSLIEEQTQRLAKITRDIADFASPRPRERELTDINGLIRSTTRLLGYDRRFRGIALRQELDTRLPAVEAVPDQITQVLMNLLINAMDAVTAVSRQEPEIVVVSRLTDQGVAIEVKDNGPGMDAGTLDHVFEPFFTTKEPGKGTGLGLSLCDSIVTAHRGSLRMDSKPGKGTSVTVVLPAVPLQEAGVGEVGR